MRSRKHEPIPVENELRRGMSKSELSKHDIESIRRFSIQVSSEDHRKTELRGWIVRVAEGVSQLTNDARDGLKSAKWVVPSHWPPEILDADLFREHYGSDEHLVAETEVLVCGKKRIYKVYENLRNGELFVTAVLATLPFEEYGEALDVVEARVSFPVRKDSLPPEMIWWGRNHD
ncbi:MAG: hypothetical protein MPJ79_02400 [Alphaproteobacteria bacterium]|nr:hypothetical protein [Alphaproteobacteria bacterium]MDA7982965.1 hypothetical protein [Alphaproteobacteria bacterium]MDA7989104.1 hypothetical protein [Alphaproteobacteria bacterium]MDA8008973.1 hypothetical protein [Alphaproteobacteria bacterium]